MQAILDGFRGEPRAVLFTVEAFFLDGGYQFAVLDQRGRSVPVIGIDSENVQANTLPLSTTI